MSEADAIKLFKCLSDKSRLQILKSLIKEEMYVERLAERLGLTPATISFHLKKLELEKSFSPSMGQMLGYFEMCTNQTLISIIKFQKLFLPCVCL